MDEEDWEFARDLLIDSLNNSSTRPFERAVCRKAAQIVGLTAAILDVVIDDYADGYGDGVPEVIALRKLAEMLTDE